MFYWIVKDTWQYLEPFYPVQKNELESPLKMLSAKCVYKLYIFDIYAWIEFDFKLPTMVDVP